MTTKKSPKYTNEFKQTIVNLYHSGKTYSQINHDKDNAYIRSCIIAKSFRTFFLFMCYS